MFLRLCAAVLAAVTLTSCSQDVSSSSNAQSKIQSKIVRTVDVNGVRFKIDAHFISKDMNDDAVLAQLVALVRRRGYRCDTIAQAHPFVFGGGGFVLYCNDLRYRYSIEDRGGNWTVSLD